MGLPDDVTTITVTASYNALDPLSDLVAGSVSFTPNVPLLYDTPDAVLFGAVPLAGNVTGGALSVVLPTTDQFAPPNWTYLVQENLEFGAGISKRSYYVALPSSLGATVNLNTLTPMTAAPATYSYLPTSGGTIDGNLTVDGDVTVTGALNATVSGYATDADVSTAVAAETTRAEAAEALLLPLAGGTVAGDLAVTGALTAAGWALPLLTAGRHVPYRAPSSIVTQFQAGHGWTTSGAGVGNANLNDTSIFIRGTQCATVTTAGNGAQAALSVTGLTALNLTGKMIRVTFQCSANFANLATLGFYVGSGGSGFNSNFLWNFYVATPSFLNYVQQGEWVTVCISWADLYGATGYTISAAGAPSTKTGFTSVRLAVYDDGTGNAVTVHWQSVEIVPDTSATFPNGLVSFTFDDSYQDVYDNARPVMDTYGYAGTLMTIAEQVGQPNCLTLAEMQALQNLSGWEVAGHAYTLANHNAGYETLTSEVVAADLQNLKAWLVSNGFHGESFAYPSGFFSPTTDNVPVDSIVAAYFTSGRTVISELNETWVPPMPLRMKALTGVSSAGTPVSVVTATGGVLERCAQQGAWLQLALHQIVTSGVTGSTQLLQSDFETLVAAVNGYGMAVLPVSAVTRYFS